MVLMLPVPAISIDTLIGSPTCTTCLSATIDNVRSLATAPAKSLGSPVAGSGSTVTAIGSVVSARGSPNPPPLRLKKSSNTPRRFMLSMTMSTRASPILYVPGAVGKQPRLISTRAPPAAQGAVVLFCGGRFDRSPGVGRR
jgi:hypothetical protein